MYGGGGSTPSLFSSVIAASLLLRGPANKVTLHNRLFAANKDISIRLSKCKQQYSQHSHNITDTFFTTLLYNRFNLLTGTHINTPVKKAIHIRLHPNNINPEMFYDINYVLCIHKWFPADSSMKETLYSRWGVSQ